MAANERLGARILLRDAYEAGSRMGRCSKNNSALQRHKETRRPAAGHLLRVGLLNEPAYRGFQQSIYCTHEVNGVGHEIAHLDAIEVVLNAVCDWGLQKPGFANEQWNRVA